jgi:hypothetical protein
MARCSNRSIYEERLLWVKAGHICLLKRQVPFKITISGIHICTYIADFTYHEFEIAMNRWQFVVEDAKGFKTEVYRLKKRLMLAMHGIELRETFLAKKERRGHRR